MQKSQTDSRLPDVLDVEVLFYLVSIQVSLSQLLADCTDSFFQCTLLLPEIIDRLPLCELFPHSNLISSLIKMKAAGGLALGPSAKSSTPNCILLLR